MSCHFSAPFWSYFRAIVDYEVAKNSCELLQLDLNMKSSLEMKRNRLGNHQLNALISFMEQHNLFARGQITKLGPQGHIKYKQMWEALAQILNDIGPCTKSTTQWQECWNKLRKNAKNNKSKFLTEFNKTGHNIPNIHLKESDERISEIYGEYGLGLNVVEELGFKYCNRETENPQYFINAITTDRSARVCFDIQPQFEINEVYNSEWKKAYMKPTSKQIETLVDFMERHPDLAKGRSPNEREQWSVLLVMLNNGKGAEKNLKGWQKTWSDLVNSARQNVKYFLMNKKTSILPHHERIADLFGFLYDRDEESTEIDSVACSPTKKFKINEYSNDLDGQYGPSTSRCSSNINCSSASEVSLATNASTLSTVRKANSTVTSGAFNFNQNSGKTGTPVLSKASTFINVFQEKGKELVQMLANQIIECFEKQNLLLRKSFQEQNQMLVKVLLPRTSEVVEKSSENEINDKNNCTASNNDNEIGDYVLEMLNEDYDVEFLEDELFDDNMHN